MPYNIPRGCAAAYYPETNVLVPIRHTADGSNQPVSKSIIISIEPTSTPDRAAARRTAVSLPDGNGSQPNDAGARPQCSATLASNEH